MVDILQYSITKQSVNLCTCVTNISTCAVPVTRSWVSCGVNCFYNIQPQINLYPWCTNIWSCIPTLPGTTSGFKVCAGSPCVPSSTAGTYCNCGACLAWTVPSGITAIRFQMWGAGLSNGSGCCCGGAPFGSTGAYASIIVPAIQGTVYTICAACVCCCFAQRASPASGASVMPSSFVVGTDNLSVCAEGATYWGAWASCVNSQSSTVMSTTVCFCTAGASGMQCWTNSFGDWCAYGSVNCGSFTSSTQQFPGIMPSINSIGYAICDPYNSVLAYIPGMYGCFVPGYNASTGCYSHPPIYGYETVSQCVVTVPQIQACTHSGVTAGAASSGGLYGGNASTGYLAIPGAGAYPVSVCGGCNGSAGDIGRAGMVCVSWV